MEWVVDSTALGLLVVTSALVGLLVGAGAVLLMRRGGPDGKPPRKGLVEVARIWRAKTDGQLWIQVDDDTAGELDGLDEEQRAAIKRMASNLADWAGVTLPAPPAPVIAAITAPLIQPASPPAPPAQVVSDPPVQTAPGTSMPAESAPAPAQSLPAVKPTPAPKHPDVQPPSLNPITSLRYTLEHEAKVEKKTPSLVEQVNEILQEKLAGTELEQRGISLMEIPGKGMVVIVGITTYDKVNDVPDETIRAAIRAAVVEWERKNSR